MTTADMSTTASQLGHCVNNNHAILLGMPRERNPQPDLSVRKRASRAPVPLWWVQFAESWYRAQDPKMSLVELGAELAKAVGRDEPWSHPTMSRFFNGRTTDEIADALLVKYPELPRYVYYPQDEIEATRYEAVRREADARRKREKIADHLEAVDRKAGVGNPSHERQSAAVQSSHGKTTGSSRRGGPGRRARGVEQNRT